MSFGGQIRPLPGQKGYGQRESDKLAEETREMQINLMKIQEQMKRVKNRSDETTSDQGGGRWRSARSDRGGLRKYNKDIKNGTVKRGSKGGPREMVSYVHCCTQQHKQFVSFGAQTPFHVACCSLFVLLTPLGRTTHSSNTQNSFSFLCKTTDQQQQQHDRPPSHFQTSSASVDWTGSYDVVEST